jgi:ribosomal protein L19E
LSHFIVQKEEKINVFMYNGRKIHGGKGKGKKRKRTGRTEMYISTIRT